MKEEDAGGKRDPGAVQNEPFVKSQRTYGDIEQEANKYWTEVCNEMKNKRSFPMD
jgi:hypothetical protein